MVFTAVRATGTGWDSKNWAVSHKTSMVTSREKMIGHKFPVLSFLFSLEYSAGSKPRE